MTSFTLRHLYRRIQLEPFVRTLFPAKAISSSPKKLIFEKGLGVVGQNRLGLSQMTQRKRTSIPVPFMKSLQFYGRK